jgi:dephospho-CoA kinase
MKNNLIIAITGGFATGKTTVAKIIEEKGYPVVYTDILAKHLMNKDLEIISNIKRIFGEESYTLENNLNTTYIANIVFNDNKMLDELNRIVHPKTIELMEKELYKHVKNGNSLVFAESALIFEAGLQDGFDYVICVTCDKELQIKRAMKQHKLTYEQVLKRIEAQIDLKIKEKFSDFIIKNNGSYEDLKKSTEIILNILNSSVE